MDLQSGGACITPWIAKSYQSNGTGDAHEGYFAVSLLANLGGGGAVLIISGTGGSAIGGGADFLSSEQGISELLGKLPARAEQDVSAFRSAYQKSERQERIAG